MSRTDTERLDWLARMKPDLCPMDGTWEVNTGRDGICATHDDIREAIDKAMLDHSCVRAERWKKLAVASLDWLPAVGDGAMRPKGIDDLEDGIRAAMDAEDTE